MTRRGLVLGCGGTVGGAWTVGALSVLERALDWDARTADVIVGTSSGSTIAAMLGAGVSVTELVDAQRNSPKARDSVRHFFTRPPKMMPKLPLGLPASPMLTLAGVRSRSMLMAASGVLPAGRTDTSFLRALVDDLVPDGRWVDHPATWIVAVDLHTGLRIPFGSLRAPDVSLCDAVAASWAVPGWYAPVTINGVRYADGGISSPASADLVARHSLDEVVVVAPMVSFDGASGRGVGGRVERVLRTPMSRTLDREVRELERNGLHVLRVHPGSTDLAAMGPNFMDGRRRLPALNAALSLVPDRLAALMQL